MDNLTHSLVGLMMSRCGLDSLGKNKDAKGTAVMLMLAANAPDIDAYPFFTNALDYLEIHRGYTHALVFAPIVALLPMAIVKGVTKTRPSLIAWISCTLAVLSHLLLDWTNVYGIRLLLPFSDRWLRLDITNVVDPFIWIILAVALAIPSLLGLVSSTIGAKKTSGVTRAWAWIALLMLGGYEYMRWNSHAKATGALNSLLYMDEPAQAVYAFPDSFGTLQWRGVVEGEKFVYEIPVDFSGNFTMRNAKLDYKIGHAPTVDAAKETHTFQVFESFNQVPFWRINPMVDVTEVVLLDLRFGSIASNSGTFVASAMVEPDGRIRDVTFGFGR
ncbi:MAG: metal-dependent hydrolase [Bryobacteraceae bacterium]